MLSVYLAGPGVFRADALEYAAWQKARCAAHGFEGRFPADVEIDPSGRSPAELAAAIFARDVALIDACDVVTADLSPFRGPEPDSGTAFELGYAHARGKHLYGYTDPHSHLVERVEASGILLERDAAGDLRDPWGHSVEEFGSPVNLMLAVPVTVVIGDLDACLARMAHDLP